MKLAEALQERADLVNNIERLRSRVRNNAQVQEGEEPAENPKALIKELNSCIERFEYLAAGINKTNNENWKLNYNNKEKIIIYPVQTKKSYTLDLPYSEMFRQFNDVINKTNSTLFIMGYSFSDEHINDIIENSLSNPFINIVLFLYSNQEECLKNEYLKKLITRACIDSRLTIFFGDTLSDFENIVSDILPIETEKNPYREVIRQLEELVRIKNGDEE